MKTSNVIKGLGLALTVCMFIAFQGCSSDETFFGVGMWNEEEPTTRSALSDFDVVIESAEFQNYVSKYKSYVDIVLDIMKKADAEDRKELNDIIELYHSEPEKYLSLLNYKSAMIIGNDSIIAKDAYCELMAAKESLLKNKNLSEKIIGNEDDYQDYLNAEIFGLHQEEYTVPLRVKTRGESENLQKCKELCEEKYESDVELALGIFTCESAASVATCIGSLGLASLGDLIAELGFAGAYLWSYHEAGVQKRICEENCELQYGDN